MQDHQLSLFEAADPQFEEFSHQNGSLYWYASTLMAALGYDDFKINAKPILKASQVCTNSGINYMEHFMPCDNEKDGKVFRDMKLTRFACYLVVMNADIKKPNVAKAQAYFAAITATIQQYFIDQEDIERIDLRGQISEHENNLNSIAKKRGVINYGYFQNKGYMGLYNMPLSKIRKIKGVPDNRTPFDYMGSEELGANIFRITQTEAKIKRENIAGQANLEKTAFEVGQTVRRAMKENGSTMPEDLPPKEDIKRIKSDLKKTDKAFKKRDSNKKIEPKNDKDAKEY